VIVDPRNFNPAIDLVSVRAAYNDKEVAFHLTWDDPTESKGDGKQTFPDAIAMQFPAQLSAGTERPYFLMGDGSDGGYYPNGSRTYALRKAAAGVTKPSLAPHRRLRHLVGCSVVVGLLEPGHVILRYALRILRVLRLGACVMHSRVAIRVEGGPRSGGGVARCGVPCLRRADGLAGLAFRAGYGVDVGGQGHAGGGHEQAGHYRREEMFHRVLLKALGFRRGLSGLWEHPAR